MKTSVKLAMVALFILMVMVWWRIEPVKPSSEIWKEYRAARVGGH